MNRDQLLKFLNDAGVPNELFNLDGIGRKDERLCLNHTNGQWEVYFTERGIKTTDKIFETEEDACQYIFQQLADF